MRIKKGNRKLRVIASLIFLNIIFLVFYLFNNFSLNEVSSQHDYSELSQLSGNEDFDTLREYFTNLANERGAAYAYEILKRAKVAPGTDMHLMGHVVGDILYQQEGANGMQHCTQDFRNACSHTIVVGLFSEEGIGALSSITEACKKAPGGKGAYNMCFHGLGHGVLSFVGYDIEKAVDICMSIKKSRADGREAPECVGGIIMEIISGGDHDKEFWAMKKQEQMKSDDPLYPCNSDIIPQLAKGMCYVYLTPYLFEFAGGNIGLPTEEDFKNAFEYCKLLATDDPNRSVCFEGFGKEFVTLAKSRDIRKIESLTDEEMEKVIKWCNLASDQRGIMSCQISAVASMYWGGENTFKTPLKFCNMLEGEEERNCFMSLSNMVKFYGHDSGYVQEYCNLVPSQHRIYCN